MRSAVYSYTLIALAVICLTNFFQRFKTTSIHAIPVHFLLILHMVKWSLFVCFFLLVHDLLFTHVFHIMQTIYNRPWSLGLHKSNSLKELDTLTDCNALTQRNPPVLGLEMTIPSWGFCISRTHVLRRSAFTEPNLFPSPQEALAKL